MERIRGYKEAVDTLEETTNGVAREIVNAGDIDRGFLMAQLDKFFSITYLLKFELERMMDEVEGDVECDGQMNLSNMLSEVDKVFEDLVNDMKKNKRRDA